MKRLPFFWLILGVVVLFLHLSFLGSLELYSITPDWFLLVVIFVSLYLPLPQSLVVNWFVGILKDIASNAGFGSFGFLFISTGLFIYFLKAVIFREDFTAQLLIAFSASYFCHFLYGVGLASTYGTIPFTLVLIKSFFIALATMFIAAIIFAIQFQIRRLLLKREEKEIHEMMENNTSRFVKS